MEGTSRSGSRAARGKPVDRGADPWSFGCVLSEMLTATRVFDGETISDTLSAVIRAVHTWMDTSISR